MADLFGASLAAATIARISQDCAQLFICFADAVCDRVAPARIQRANQTSCRIAGKPQWLHIALFIWLLFYCVAIKPGKLRRAPLPMGRSPPSDIANTSWIVLISGKI